ncbi:MAG: tetratricopeptide repeat protein [Alphaproteobacteria bacterium]|nr:tetratricopeptide repeat protein [Alphaproteobacteria bacterium]
MQEVSVATRRFGDPPAQLRMGGGRPILRLAMHLLRLALALLFLGLAVAAPALAGPREDQLDKMFARLKDTQSETEASALTQAIWILWTTSDDSNVNDMMRRGIRLMNAQSYDQALDIFDRMVKYAPEFAEGWNKRATVHYMLGNFTESVADIQKTLALEPRHFGALSGLGMINIELERGAEALKAFEAALKANPFLPGARQQIQELKKKLQGSPT